MRRAGHVTDKHHETLASQVHPPPAPSPLAVIRYITEARRLANLGQQPRQSRHTAARNLLERNPTGLFHVGLSLPAAANLPERRGHTAS